MKDSEVESLIGKQADTLCLSGEKRLSEQQASAQGMTDGKVDNLTGKQADRWGLDTGRQIDI